MKPFSSNSIKENCSPISSNCVEWQGPIIPCINICNGDSVSDIVYKVSQKVCNLQDNALLTSVNLSCLLETCSTLQAPTDNSLGNILQTIVDGICCSVNKLSLTTTNLNARTSNLYNEPSLILPVNLQYVDPSTGLPVAQLPLGRFAENIGTTTSQLKTTVSLHTAQISNQEQRLQTVESAPGYTPPLVTPLCSYGGIVSGVPIAMDLLLSVVENDYCIYKSAIGSTSDIGGAISNECPFLGSTAALGQSGNMSGILGWNNSVSNLAQSIQNLWLTVCDMRTAVNTIKQNITPDCSQFILGYQIIPNETRHHIILRFNTNTTVPSGFDNCPTYSRVTITDGTTTYVDNAFNLTTYATNSEGITYDVYTAGLNPSLPYTVTVDGCLVNGSTTCSKSVTLVNSPISTTTTAAPNITYTIVVQDADISAATGNTDTYLDNKVFASYINGSTGNPVVDVFDTATAGLNRCVKGGSIPMVYHYQSNVVTSGESAAYSGATC